MLTEEAQVVSARGESALVRTHRSEACHHCLAQSACGAMGGGKEIRLEVRNPIRAQAGDRVELALPEHVFLKASLVLYLIPLAAVMGGAVLGLFVAAPLGWSEDQAGMLLAGIGLVGSLAAVFGLNRRLSARREFVPRIVRVLPPLPEENGGI